MDKNIQIFDPGRCQESLRLCSKIASFDSDEVPRRLLGSSSQHLSVKNRNDLAALGGKIKIDRFGSFTSVIAA
jgi:hypothetical protein